MPSDRIASTLCLHGIFTEHLDLLGIEWRWSNGHTISVARRDSVARLDAFVGPKR